ncbi:MAG TPA: DUF1566 domain-containing protein, partial [Polyangiaceae bacterium]
MNADHFAFPGSGKAAEGGTAWLLGAGDGEGGGAGATGGGLPVMGDGAAGPGGAPVMGIGAASGGVAVPEGGAPGVGCPTCGGAPGR